MATAVCTSPIGNGALSMTEQSENQVSQPKQLRPDLQEVVADIVALKAMTKNEHFITHKAQREILSKLNPSDLAAVARAIAEEEKRHQPIYIRK